MRGISLRVQLDPKALAQGQRYQVRVGDGVNSVIYTLADPKSHYNTPQWNALLGEANASIHWQTRSSEGMYVDVFRQYPNPNFDFQPESYQRAQWLTALWDVTTFRLYNPFLARPCLDWPTKNGWGNSVPFSEWDSHSWAYSIDDYEANIHEHDVKYKVTRTNDSDDYKEFSLELSV